MTNSRTLVRGSVRPRASETRALGWYRQAKETKRGEMGGRKSEHFIVPSSQGNSGPGNPAEGRRCRVVEPLAGNTTDAWNPSRVNVTPADSIWAANP